jgi:hypothetical protein
VHIGLVPSSACVASNRGVRSLREMPKGPCSIQGLQAGKAGRVNANELSMMPRHDDSRRWVAPAGDRDWPLEYGRRRLGIGRQSGVHRRPRGAESTLPGRVSLMRNVTIPMESRWYF